jgi:hypothetical protein
VAALLVQAVGAPPADLMGRPIAAVDFWQRDGALGVSLGRQAGWRPQERAHTRRSAGEVLVLQGEAEALARVAGAPACRMLGPCHGEPAPWPWSSPGGSGRARPPRRSTPASTCSSPARSPGARPGRRAAPRTCWLAPDGPPGLEPGAHQAGAVRRRGGGHAGPGRCRDHRARCAGGREPCPRPRPPAGTLGRHGGPGGGRLLPDAPRPSGEPRGLQPRGRPLYRRGLGRHASTRPRGVERDLACRTALVPGCRAAPGSVDGWSATDRRQPARTLCRCASRQLERRPPRRASAVTGGLTRADGKGRPP